MSSPRRSLVTVVLGTLAAAVVLAGCGEEAATPKPKAVSLEAPASIKAAGELRFCSDIGYPPMEFEQDGAPVGADIDIARHLAKLMDVRATFVQTPFDDIMGAVGSGKCDAAISALTNTAERRKQVAFVDYLEFGQSIMVQTSNPREIEDLEDLAGAKVSVQAGTVNEDFLRGQAGTVKPPIQITTFEKDTDATAALQRGEVHAYLGDSPVVAYHIGREALTYSFAGDPINPEPVGIAVSKDAAELQDELQRGVNAMYEDRSMHRILRTWKLEDFALRG